MKLKFKTQAYQTHAVDSVVDCFVHQPMHDGLTYRIDPGQRSQASAFDNEGFKNADLAISEAKVLENIQAVQRRQNLPVAESLTEFTTYDKRVTGGPSRRPTKGCSGSDTHPSGRGDGDRYWQNLLLHQDNFRDEQTLWLEQVHHHGAVHCHP